MMISLAVLISSLLHSPSQQTWKPLYEFLPSHTVVHLSWQDSSTLVVGTLDGVLGTWDVRKKRMVKQVVMGREVRAYILNTKGRLFTLHADGSVGLRSSATGEVLKRFEFGDEGKYGERRVLDIRPLANGRCLVVIHDARMAGGGEYVEIDPDRGTAPSSWNSAPVLCPSGKHYGVWLDKETIALLDSETRKRWRVIKVGAGWYGMVLSNDCSHLAVVNASQGTPGLEIRVFTTADGKVRGRVTQDLLRGEVVSYTLSPHGESLAVGTSADQVYLIRLRDRKIVRVYGAGGASSYPVSRVVFSGDGKLLAIAFNQFNSQGVKVYPVP